MSMRLPEQRLWDRMRRGLKPYGGILMHRIENVVGEGMPDVVACCDGKTSFIELKCVESVPKRDSTLLLGRKGLSAAQKNWHHSWAMAGGISYVLIGHGENIAMLDGQMADEINDMVLIDVLHLSLARNWLMVATELGAR